MGAVVQLSTGDIDVEPGRPATLTIQVRNTGNVVDRFGFEALGPGAAWVTFSPETLSLFPQASGSVNVVISAPREPSAAAGETPLGLRVTSSEDPAGSVVEEATMKVAPFSAITTELVPRMARGRFRGTAKLAVDNLSNCAYAASVSGTDPRGALDLGFSPSAIEVPPGETVFVKTRMRPLKKFWRGPSVTLPYKVVLDVPADASGPHPPSVTADGTLTQEALLPKWLLKAAAALLALIVLFVILWFVLFKPQIRSTAKDQVKKQLQAAGFVSTPAAPGGGASKGGGTSTAATTPPSTGSTGPSTSQSINGSAQASGNGSQVVYTVAPGKTLLMTDLLVENPAGDTGTLILARSGTPLMQWSLANFRDLDYHWITPTVFGPGTQLQLVVSGCPGACTPALYYAGSLTGS